MSQLDKFLQRREKLDELSEWLVRNSYWTVQKVANYLSTSDEFVRDLPEEVLPAVNLTPHRERATRRYCPTDVFALRAFLAEYEKAISEGDEAAAAWLTSRRQKIADRRHAMKMIAMEAA